MSEAENHFGLDQKARNSKFEIRNKFENQNTNDQNTWLSKKIKAS